MPSPKSPRPSAPARPAAPGSAPTSGAVSQAPASLSSRDLERAREEALFQLRIGRSAHYSAVAVAGLLLVDALLVLFFPPNLAYGRPIELRDGYFLLLPVVAGLYLAALAVWIKWESFGYWPWEPHLAWSVGTLAGAVALTSVVAAGVGGVSPVRSWSLLPWGYPATMLVVSAALAGLALTWPELSHQKFSSLVTAAIPAPLALVVYDPALTHSTAADALALSLTVAAVLYQMSGSFLHLIASGTQAHERELISSVRSRINDLSNDLRNREQAVRFRETALLGREADLEQTEMVLRHQKESADDRQNQLTALETDLRTRSGTLQRLQKELALKLSETNSERRTLAERTSALGLREHDVQERFAVLGARERDVARREGLLNPRESEIARRQGLLEEQVRQATELAKRVESRRAEIDRKTEELLQREREAPSKDALAAADGRAAELQEREATLRKLADELAADRTRLESDRNSLGGRETELAGLRTESERKLEELRGREAELGQREAGASEKMALAESQVQRYRSSLEALERKIQAADARTAQLLERTETLSRSESEIAGRQRSLEEREGALASQRGQLERREHDLVLREAEVRTTGAELRLQRQAFALGKARDVRDYSPVVATRPSPAARAPEPEGPPETPPATSSTGVRFADRIATGTPRLDDLLMGGLPANGHVMLVGDAFTGKEVVMYSFLAEGLKRGEPAIIVTASRPPEEVGPKVGLVAPQLREYEQLDMVRWVDASGATAGASAAGPEDGRRFVTPGPQDRAALITALLKAEKSLGKRDHPIRLVFLGLSAVLAHADEAQRVPFVQNVVAVLKPRNSLALYAMESGTLPETQMETVLSRMDGVLYFKIENGRTFLSVQGMGEVASRDWIEYRLTGRGVTIGSFALERIR